MDLMRLNKDTFIADELIERKTSLIWTERYTFNGEFELRTPFIKETLALLPELSLVCIRESKEVMFVENHVIEKAKDGDGLELVTTGRSFETFLENRYFGGYEYDKKYKMPDNRTWGGAAMYVMWNWLVNDLTTDAINPSFSRPGTHDVIPNVVITDTVNGSYTSKKRFLLPGPIYDEVLRFLNKGKLGIRTIRPPGTDGTIFTVDPNTAVVTRTDTEDISELRIDVYDGVDRTDTVIFDYSAGHLIDPKYVFSSKDFKTGVHVAHDLGVVDEEFFRDGDDIVCNYDDGFDEDLMGSGLDRRIGYLDAGSKPSDASNAEWRSYLDDYVINGLNLQFKDTALFDATASSNSPYKIGDNFLLGDKVKLRGDYGLTTDCRVVEHIRSESKLGELSYPTLSRL